MTRLLTLGCPDCDAGPECPSPTFWQGVAFLLIGGPLAVLFASWLIALGLHAGVIAEGLA